MKLYNADKFVTEKTLQLGGKTFDVSLVPDRISVVIFQNAKDFDSFSKGQITEENFETVIKLITLMLKRSDDSIDEKWVENNLDVRQMQEIVDFLFNEISEDDEKNKGKKKSLKGT